MIGGASRNTDSLILCMEQSPNGAGLKTHPRRSEMTKEIDTEKLKAVLVRCIAALKELHPIMDETEPCNVYQAYRDALWAVHYLEEKEK